jgi:transposase-like protein
MAHCPAREGHPQQGHLPTIDGDSAPYKLSNGVPSVRDYRMLRTSADLLDEEPEAAAAGPVAVKAPRVNDKRIDPETGERKRFSSAILPAWARKTPKISEVLPLLYLHGLSTGDFVPALEQFLGSAAGLSSATISRLTAQWTADHDAFERRELSGCDYVYVWADGIHLKVRLEEAKASVLVLLGVRADGRKELISLDAGYRESVESWANLLRDAARCGMRAPVLAVGDGALGFWKALREVFPDAREQRCWVHKTANVLDALPKSAQPAAKAALAEVRGAEDREHAQDAVKAFAKTYGAKFPKAVAKLIESAQDRWRAVNAPHLVALVRAGARFERGHLVEREQLTAA